jgi:pimeloyl-ACP methyl ester carboxylesterase
MQPMAQRSQRRVFFGHKDMDYYFSWILGREVFDGSEAEECFRVASRIEDGDPISWQMQWLLLAERVEAEAKLLRKDGDDRACKAFLRACTYYRAPLFMMDPKIPHFHNCWEKLHFCFQQSAELFNPSIETIQVAFQSKKLPGYFWKADDNRQKRPTLIVIGGIETFAEDGYFITGPFGTRRGYNLMTVDLPGQGMNPKQGLYLDARSEMPIKAVINYALSRPDVDPDRLALFGFSWGGHIVLRAAQYDRRIKALVANPATHNMFRSGLAQQSSHGRSDPVVRLVFEQIAWRFGLSLGDIFHRLVKGFEFMAYARANCGKIQCPTLCMAGESEAKVTLNQTRECFKRLPNPKKRLAILRKGEGGDEHCQVYNLELLNRVIFDWLDEVFRVQ